MNNKVCLYDLSRLTNHIEEAKKLIIMVVLQDHVLTFVTGDSWRISVPVDTFLRKVFRKEWRMKWMNKDGLEIIDFGQTVKFGDYEIASDYIIATFKEHYACGNPTKE